MIISDLNYLEVVQSQNIVGGIADIYNYNLDFYEVLDVYEEFNISASDICDCEGFTSVDFGDQASTGYDFSDDVWFAVSIPKASSSSGKW